MIYTTKTTVVFLFSLLLMSLSPQVSQAQSGDPQETLDQYISDLRKNPDDNALREKIIKHVQTMSPAPVVPEEVLRYEGRAEAAVRNAKTPEDYIDAVKEYKKALLIAPWVAPYYFNLGIILEKAGQPDEAIRTLKLYLLASPGAQDARGVKKRIAGLEYEIEYRKEKAQKEAKLKAEEKAKTETSLESLTGNWKARMIEWGQRYSRPELTMSSQWSRDSGFYVKVTVNRDTFEATAYTDSPVQAWYVFRGNLAGKRIYGTMTDVNGSMEQLCNKGQTTYRFEGEISQQSDAILLIVQGSQLGPGGSCRYDANSYIKSMRLHR